MLTADAMYFLFNVDVPASKGEKIRLQNNIKSSGLFFG
jgi:hypothetical protein